MAISIAEKFMTFAKTFQQATIKQGNPWTTIKVFLLTKTQCYEYIANI